MFASGESGYEVKDIHWGSNSYLAILLLPNVNWTSFRMLHEVYYCQFHSFIYLFYGSVSIDLRTINDYDPQMQFDWPYWSIRPLLGAAGLVHPEPGNLKQSEHCPFSSYFVTSSVGAIPLGSNSEITYSLFFAPTDVSGALPKSLLLTFSRNSSRWCKVSGNPHNKIHVPSVPNPSLISLSSRSTANWTGMVTFSSIQRLMKAACW